jgi:hypothetical protein
MTKNEFKAAAKATGQVLWTKYSGHTKTFYVCCFNSHAGVELQGLAKDSHFKVIIG